MTAYLAADDGTRIPLDPDRWRRQVDPTELAVLSAVDGPVLDIGCGPGRIAEALAASGRVVLAIDSSPVAAAEAAARGVAVLCRSVFDPVPGEGRWRAAVLLDGNIGIGGNPRRLLGRIAELLSPGGQVVAEVEPPWAATTSMQVRLGTDAAGASGPSFPWATVAAGSFEALASATGFTGCTVARHGDRWFARAVKR